MALTKQQYFIDKFMQHVEIVLALMNAQQSTCLEEALELANQAVSILDTTWEITHGVLSLAGIAAAVPTAGLSLAAANTIISALKTLSQVYKSANRFFYGDPKNPLKSNNIRAAEEQLHYKMLCREVAYNIATTRYRHIIEEILVDKGIVEFAQYGAERTLKKIEFSLKSSFTLPSAQAILDDLCGESITYGSITPQRTLTVKEKYQSGHLFDSEYYAKWAYARPRGIEVTFARTAKLNVYASSKEKKGLSAQRHQETTMAKYGYVVLPLTSLSIYVTRQKAQPFIFTAQFEEIKTYLCAFYEVTRADVEAYLTEVRTATWSSSFNDYLTNKFQCGIRILAECHDDRLKNLDLSLGDFSYVNFRRADLRGCILTETCWQYAQLDEVKFGDSEKNTSLQSVSFQGATAEKSYWENVVFAGANFSEVRISGAYLKKCTLHNLVSINSLWELAILDEMTLEPSFVTQLNEEAQARFALEKKFTQRMEVLEKKVDALTAQVDDVTLYLNVTKLTWPVPDFSVPAHIPQPLYPFYGAYLKAFENPLLQQTLHYYIEPDYVPSQWFSDAQRRPLYDRLNAFLNEAASLLLLHGDVGSGKSTVARLWQQRLWECWKDSNDWIPLVIELKQVPSKTPNFLKDRLQAYPYRFSEEQIRHLQQHYRFFMILDGLDECPDASLRHIQHDCALHEWHAKVLLTARTEWLQAQVNYRQLLKPNSHQRINEVIECRIAMFTPRQIDHYLEQRFSAKDKMTYQAILQKESELQALATSPVMLHILGDVLPFLTTATTSTAKHNRTWLYKTFLTAWFQREIDKPHPLDILREPDDVLMSYFSQYTQQLAFQMFCEKTLLIEHRVQEKAPDFIRSIIVEETAWEKFFDNKDPLVQQAQRSCPLSLERFEQDSIRVHRYQFIHKSFMEYAVATFLWQTLQNDSLTICLTRWNGRFITEERGILSFLLEWLTQSSTRVKDEERLLEIVYASRNNSSVAKAASSAITLLNKAYFNFSQLPTQNLSHVCIPHADLSEALLAYVDLSNSDLSDVNLHNAVLVGSSLRYAQLTGTRFLAGHTFILSQAPVDAMACHPTRFDLVAYGEKDDIVIARLSDGCIEQRLQGHTCDVKSVAWSLDGRLASGSWSGDFGVRVWDVTSPSVEACFQIFPGHTDEVNSIAWSSGGRLASGSDDGTVRVWDVTQPATEACLMILKGQHTVAWSTDGRLATIGANRTISIWDVTRSSAEEACIATLKGHTGSITSIAWSVDGRLASGSRDKTVRVWDPTQSTTEKCLATLTGHQYSVESIAWSNDGLLASGSTNKSSNTPDNDICIWDPTLPKKQACLTTLMGHTWSVTNLTWLTDGRLISGSWDQTIRVWDITAETHNTIVDGHTDTVKSVAWSTDGLLASGGRDGVCIWNCTRPTTEMRLVVLTNLGTTTESVSWSTDGRLAYSSGSDVSIYNPALPGELICLGGVILPRSVIESVAWSIDGLLAAGDEEGNLCVWDPTQPKGKTRKIMFYEAEGSESIKSVAWSVDGRLASSGHGALGIWDPRRPQKEARLSFIGASFDESIAWSVDGYLAIGSWNGNLRIYKPEPSKKWETFWLMQSTGSLSLMPVWCVAWSDDGRWLISGTSKEILFWNSKNWNEKPHSLPFGASTFSLHGSLLALGHGHDVHVLDLTDFPRTLRWVMAISRTLWLQGCDVLGATGYLLQTQHLLEKEGAIHVKEKNIKKNEQPEINSESTDEKDVINQKVHLTLDNATDNNGKTKTKTSSSTINIENNQNHFFSASIRSTSISQQTNFVQMQNCCAVM